MRKIAISVLSLLLMACNKPMINNNVSNNSNIIENNATHSLNTEAVLSEDAYSRVATTILSLWSYPEYQKFVGVKKVPNQLQSCYLSQNAREYALKSNLESLPAYKEYTEKDVLSFLEKVDDDFTNYYRYHTLYHLSESYSNDLDNQAESEIEKRLDEIPDFDMNNLKSLLNNQELMKYRTLFSLGNNGRLTMQKSTYALLDVDIIGYCKKNNG